MAEGRSDEALEYVQRIMDRIGLSPDYVREIAALKPVRGYDFLPAPPDVALGANPPSLLLGFLLFPLRFFYRINVHKLEQKLSAVLDATGVGYSYLIRRKGKAAVIRSSGWAQRPGDGDLPWRFDVPMDSGSIAKIITAAVVKLLLDSNGISESSPVRPYLPTYWGQGRGVSQITWRDLLRHESGLGAAQDGSGPTTYKAGREAIGQGVSDFGDPLHKTAHYKTPTT